jgi:tRNA G10  N-methylase Trm11
MKFLIKFAQTHETFRVAEIEALAVIEGLDLTILHYDLEVSLAPLFHLHGISNRLLDAHMCRRSVKR